MKLTSVVPAFAFDIALIIVFAAIGRSSHARESTLAGLLETAWPFLAGLTLMWLIALVWKSPLAPLRSGVPLWIGTLALGMLFRLLSDQGTALPFVLVAAGTIGAMLVGWRVIWQLVQLGRRKKAVNPTARAS